MDRAYRIGLLARQYRLLSERPEFMTTDQGELIDRMLDAHIALGALDRTLILHAGELDRVCAHSVRVLRGQSDKPLLDALGFLDPDRIIAIYYALPKRRRSIVRKDPAWAYHIDNAPPETAEVVAVVGTDARESREAEAERARHTGRGPRPVQNITEEHERAALRAEAGLGGDLAAQIIAVFDEELGKLGADRDEHMFQAACSRAVKRCGALQ